MIENNAYPLNPLSSNGKELKISPKSNPKREKQKKCSKFGDPKNMGGGGGRIREGN